MRKIDAHPDAAIFPMMADDELADLAADIKANGQRFPIVIGKHEDREVIIDGRNRFAACEIAGVEPKFEQLNGHDPKAFILSVNINRRHLTVSQRTMATAMIYPEIAKPWGVKKEGRAPSAQLLDVHRSTLAKARFVLRHSPALAEAVLAGTKMLKDAWSEAQLASGKTTNDAIRLRKLRDIRPDLAERVVQGDVTLDEAYAQEKREADELRQQRWAATVNLIDGVKLLDRDAETAAEIAKDFDPAIVDQRGETFTPARLRRVATFVTALANIMEQGNAQDV